MGDERSLRNEEIRQHLGENEPVEDDLTNDENDNEETDSVVNTYDTNADQNWYEKEEPQSKFIIGLNYARKYQGRSRYAVCYCIFSSGAENGDQ